MVSLLGVGLVETLWSYLEAKVFHHLKNMVVALKNMHGEVAEGVVTLLVIYPKERRYLWETLAYMDQQSLGRLLVGRRFEMKLHQHHPFARVAVAYHHIAQQARLLS